MFLFSHSNMTSFSDGPSARQVIKQKRKIEQALRLNIETANGTYFGLQITSETEKLYVSALTYITYYDSMILCNIHNHFLVWIFQNFIGMKNSYCFHTKKIVWNIHRRICEFFMLWFTYEYFILCFEYESSMNFSYEVLKNSY